MKTRIFSCFVIALFFSACQEPPKKNTPCCISQKESKISSKTQLLKINISDEPQTLDPRKARSLKDINLCKLFMEGITRLGKNNKAELALAKEYTVSEDLKIYSFKLKKSNWSNGDPLTAHDFIYAWKKTLNPNFPSDYAYQLFSIKNAKAIKNGSLPSSLLGAYASDDETLVIELEYPVPYLLELLSLPVFFPVNNKIDRKDAHWAEKSENYVCNGPFLLDDWKHQNLLIAKKNPNYWNKNSVKLEQLEMFMVNESTALNMFQNHELHWEGSPFSTIPADAIKTLKENNVLKTSPFLGTCWIRVNLEKTPLNSLAFRKALAYAINRKLLVDHVTQGNQIPATGIIPPSMNIQREAYFPDGDKIQAVKLFETALSELNLTKEIFPEITLTYSAGERSHRIAQAIQQEWFETFGIKISLQSLESKVYFDAISKQNYQLAIGSWIADFNDPVNFLDIFKTKQTGINNTNWENLKYSSLLELSNFERNEEKRKKLLQECEQILINEMPIIPIFHYTMLHVQDPFVKDVLLTHLGSIDFKEAYLKDTP